MSGTLFDPVTSENVSIQSNLHLVWRPDGTGGGTLHGNLADSTATGLTSTDSYSFTGADEVTITGPPITPITVNFRLVQGPPIREQIGPPIRVAVAVQLTFNDNGQLASASAQLGPHSF